MINMTASSMTITSNRVLMMDMYCKSFSCASANVNDAISKKRHYLNNLRIAHVGLALLVQCS